MRVPLASDPEPNEHRCSPKTKRLTFEFHERLSAVAIVLSVVITFLEACFISSERMRTFSDWAQAMFAFTFCSLQAYGFQYYTSKRCLSCVDGLRKFFLLDSDANWNVFDLVLNLISILDMFLDTFEGRFVHALSALRVVRIVRLVRLLRLIRLLGSSKFMEDFSKVSHIAVWQMLNFLAVILAFLLVLSICATNMLWDFPDAEVAACYGNLGATMWTLFKIMTMDGWISSIEPVITLHPPTLYFFAIFVFLSLSSVSIVPAIFIDVMLEDRDRERRRRAARRRGSKRNRSLHRPLLSARVAESWLQPDNAEDSEVSCHSGSDSSHTSDLELETTYYNRQLANSDVTAANAMFGPIMGSPSVSYHQVHTMEDGLKRLEAEDLRAVARISSDCSDCVSRCIQLSSELRLVQLNLEANLNLLMSKLEERGPGKVIHPEQPEHGVGLSRSDKLLKEQAASAASAASQDEAVETFVQEKGRPASSRRSSFGGSDTDRSSGLGQVLDPEDGLAIGPI